MGTNYYWRSHTKVCLHCGSVQEEDLHIGKSSGGWEFSFHAEPGIRSYQDWLDFFRKNGPMGRIEDEYGRTVTVPAFKSLVAEKQGGLNHTEETGGGFLDPEGYSFCEGEFS